MAKINNGVEFPHFVKNIYKNSKANTIFSGDKFEAFSLRSGAKHEYPLSPWLFYYTKRPANAVKTKIRK